jgi:hypothetical protein
MSHALYKLECNSCKAIKHIDLCRQVNIKVFGLHDFTETEHLLCLTCIQDLYGALDQPMPSLSCGTMSNPD